MNMLFLVSDEGFTAITGYMSDNSGTPIAENSYGYNIWRDAAECRLIKIDIKYE